jgi:hypothetical protein
MESGEIKIGAEAEIPQSLQDFVGNEKILFVVKTSRLYPKLLGGIAKIMNIFFAISAGCFALVMLIFLISSFSITKIQAYFTHFSFTMQNIGLFMVFFITILTIVLILQRIITSNVMFSYMKRGNRENAENWFVATKDELIIGFLKEVQRYFWSEFEEIHAYNLESGNWVALRRRGQKSDDVFLCDLKDLDLVKKIMEERINQESTN